MPFSLLDQAICALIAPDGRGSAGRVLRLLVGYTRARSAALLEIRAGRSALFTGVDLAQDALDAAATAWKAAQPELASGETVHHGSYFVVPLRHDRQLVGLLVIESPKKDGLAHAVHAVERLLVEALQATRHREDTNPGEALRILLDENEWNLARVARILGVSRPTVYARLARYRIARHKVVRGDA